MSGGNHAPKLRAFASWREMNNSAWIVFCCIILLTAVVSSIVVYLQVSHELTRQMEQHLYWEAKFYREQLDQIFVRAALRLDNLMLSTGAATKNAELLQNELLLMNNNSPSVVRSWVAYPDGALFPSPNTRPQHVMKLPWWSEYLQGRTPDTFMGYILGRTQAMVGRPFTDPIGMALLVPLISIDTQRSKMAHAAGLELDINRALVDNTGVDIDWANEPVSIYSTDGQLLASPYRYYNGNFQAMLREKRSPLLQQMLKHPEQEFGFTLYQKQKQKIAGVFLHDPTLGMVVTVERPAADVVDPIRRITAGPLVVALLCVIIATLFAGTIYANLRKLRVAEDLRRTAEFRALQAHINPHFLFNTLDRMVGFAIASGNTPLVAMVRSLSNIFRYATRNPNAVVPLREELQYLREYIALQQIRYDHRFSFQLNVADSLLDVPVIKFSIQPLVENCFVHAVEKRFDPVAITVTVIPAGGTLEIQVTDDGPGISAERLREVTAALQEEHPEQGGSGNNLGIANIHFRIRYAYGTPYGIILESGQPGLRIRLRIPLTQAKTIERRWPFRFWQ